MDGPPDSHSGCKAIFTTNLIPITKPGLKGSYEVPLGFILSPMAPLQAPKSTSTSSSNSNSNQSLMTEKDMYLCIKCLSYLNMYCKFVENGTKWVCPICDQVNASGTNVMNMQMMKSEVVEYHQKAATMIRQNSNSNGSVYEHAKNVTIIIIDGNLPSNEVQSILSNLSSTFSAKDNSNNHDDNEEQMIGLIIYTSIINIYQIGVQGIASADIYSILNSDDYDGNDGYGDVNYSFDNENNGGVINNSIFELENDRMYLGSSWDQVQLCTSVYFGLHDNSSANDTTIIDRTASTQNDSDNGICNDSSNNHCQGDVNYYKDKKERLSRRQMLRFKREERIKKKEENNNTSIENASGFNLGNCTPDQAAEWVQQHLRNSKKTHRKKDKNTLRNKKRCTGEAAAYGIALASSIEERHNARVLLFTNGCSNIGIGSVTSSSLSQQEALYNTNENGDNDLMVDARKIEYASRYFDAIGQEAFEGGIGIDVFCSGNNTTLGAQALLALVQPSTGYVLSHMSFDEEQFKKNLEYVLSSTHMSWTKNQDIDSVRLGMACPNWRNVINGCLVDLRLPRFLTPTSFNGPGKVIDIQKKHTLSNEHEIFLSCSKFASDQGIPTNNFPSKEALQSTRTRLRIGRFDSQSTFTIMMQVDETSRIPTHLNGNNFFYFQFITRYLNPNNVTDLVTRVVSQKLPVSVKNQSFNEHNEFFNSLNKSALPLVLAKEAAYRSMVREKDEREGGRSSIVSYEEVEYLVTQTQNELDTTASRITNAHLDIHKYSPGQLPNDVEGSQNDTKSTDPPELRITLKLLHHFRRGSILGQSMQSIDDRALLRDIFLRIPLRESLVMMAPMVWMSRRDVDGTVRSMEVPAETLVLWDDCIIAADNFDSMFIWSGRETLHPYYDVLRQQCKDFLLERSKDRFPAPTLFSLKEGESMARRFSSRLVPSHGDKEDDQMSNFPALQTLPEASLRRLRSKYRMYDPHSDDTFLHWFAKVSNKNSSKRRQLRSLCE